MTAPARAHQRAGHKRSDCAAFDSCARGLQSNRSQLFRAWPAAILRTLGRWTLIVSDPASTPRWMAAQAGRCAVWFVTVRAFSNLAYAAAMCR